MKKNWKIILIVIAILAVLGIGFYIAFSLWFNEDNLSNKDKKWIDENSGTVISIAIPNDIPVFGKYGEGVFFDFADYLSENLGLSINKNTVASNSENSGYRFEVVREKTNDSLVLYSDRFAIVSKESGLLYDDNLIKSLHPGVIRNDAEYVANYFKLKVEDFKIYDSYEAITNDLNNGSLNYAIVAVNEYKEELVGNNINVLKSFSDLNKHYVFNTGGDTKTAGSILTKQFNLWRKKYFGESYDKHNYKMFITQLGITEAEEETLTNRVYKYGFAEYYPYEILSGGDYGGITAEYLRQFSNFSKVEFTYTKYRTPDELLNAAANKEIDLYYNYYDLNANYIDAYGLKSVNYIVIAHNSIDLSLTNISGLANETVYVLKDSYLHKMIKGIKNINIITYDKNSQLKSIMGKKAIVLLDKYTYDYYLKSVDNYTNRLEGTYEENAYSFKYAGDKDPFYRLFSAFANTIDNNDLVRSGISSYNNVRAHGNVVTTIALSILGLIIAAVIALIFYRRNSRGLKLNTKVKKEERLKYMDMLTSLKNRNYYSEKVDVWNKNTIYPQACIVMDINKVKELNDSFGHEEGDRQILAVANILIKTQIDNSEIMRTDGNEFLIYLVGYSEKQVVSYMKKVMKEFKQLPYDNGVAMGFSMIEDDTKLVEDAFNEASNQMRENKNLNGEINEK